MIMFVSSNEATQAAVEIDLNGDCGRRDRFIKFALLDNTPASAVSEPSFIV